MNIQTVAPPKNCQEPDVFWQKYFDNLLEEKPVFSEISFQAETTPTKPTLLQKLLGKKPKAKSVVVTMKEFDPNRIVVSDSNISLFSTETEVDAIRHMQLDELCVNFSYTMSLFPKRHKVSFHIGNLTEMKIAS